MFLHVFLLHELFLSLVVMRFQKLCVYPALKITELGSVQVYSGRGSRSPAVEGDWDLQLHGPRRERTLTYLVH